MVHDVQGYGFIEQEGGEAVFVHVSAIARDGLRRCEVRRSSSRFRLGEGTTPPTCNAVRLSSLVRQRDLLPPALVAAVRFPGLARAVCAPWPRSMFAPHRSHHYAR